MQKQRPISFFLVLITLLVFTSFATIGEAQNKNSKNEAQISLPVTILTDSERARSIVANLRAEDFIVRENKQKQQVISIKRPTEIPIILSILIQDDLVSQVGTEINGIKEFIQSLPTDSSVMTGYITSGSLQVTQEFTDDREKAANSLRAPRSNPTATVFSPYVEFLEALKRFESKPQGRRVVLLISDGFDSSEGFTGSPTSSLYLERAIKEAQKQGVTVYSFYSPSVGLTNKSKLASSYGQGALNRLAKETGAETFYSEKASATFGSYLKELNELIANQWLITYQSPSTSKDFRKIEVTTDFDLRLHYPRGYYLKQPNSK